MYHRNKLIYVFHSLCVVLCIMPLLAMSANAGSEKCEHNSEYIGPPLRLAIHKDIFPNDTLKTGRLVTLNLAQVFSETFQKLANHAGADKMSLAIWQLEQGYWSGHVGLQPDTTQTYWWASVGKMATAVVILQLLEEGRLSLQQPVSKWFPEFPGAATITIDQLLTHTSGVFSFNSDLALRKRKGYKAPQDLLDVAASHPLDFCPGTNWYYSNTGYVMLALIAEALDGSAFTDIVQNRIAEPLGLDTFRVVKKGDPETSIVKPVAASVTNIVDIAGVHGAGVIVSTVDDMLRFLHAYLGAKLVPGHLRDKAFETLYPMFGQPMSYGRGVIVFDVPDPDAPTTWLGHSGGAPGAKALLIYDPLRKAYVATVANQKVPLEAVANNLLKALDAYLAK